MRTHSPPAAGRRVARGSRITRDVMSSTPTSSRPHLRRLAELSKWLRKRWSCGTRPDDVRGAQAVLRQVRSLRPRHLPRACAAPWRSLTSTAWPNPPPAWSRRTRRGASAAAAAAGDNSLARTVRTSLMGARAGAATSPLCRYHPAINNRYLVDRATPPDDRGGSGVPPSGFMTPLFVTKAEVPTDRWRQNGRNRRE